VNGATETDRRRIVVVSNTRSRCVVLAMPAVEANTARCDVVTADAAAPSPRQTSKPTDACFWCIGQVASFLQHVGPERFTLLPQDGIVPRIAPLARSRQRTATRRRCVSKPRHSNVDVQLVFTRRRGDAEVNRFSPRLRASA
jgi:hypothetical protein